MFWQSQKLNAIFNCMGRGVGDSNPPYCSKVNYNCKPPLTSDFFFITGEVKAARPDHRGEQHD